MNIEPLSHAIRILELADSQVKEIAETAAERTDDEGTMILMAALTELELRMPESEYLEYLNRFE